MRIFLLLFLFLSAGAVGAQSPASIEKDLLGHLDNVSAYGTYAGGYDEEKLNEANDAVRNLLLKHGSRPDVLRYGFPNLRGYVWIATSRDGKLRIYSWDMENGGSMHNHANVYQYRGASGKVYAWARDEDGDPGAFYTEIFQLDAGPSPIYLTVSTFIGSTSFNSQSISAVKINGEKLDRDAKIIRTGSGLQNSISFGYDFFSVVDRPERPLKLFIWDAAKRSFRFPVVIEDDERRQGRVTDRYITYRFDGRYFVKVK